MLKRGEHGKKRKIFVSILMMVFVIFINTGNVNTFYTNISNNKETELRAPGEYGTYYTYTNLGYIGRKNDFLVKYLTPYWDYVSKYTYGSSDRFRVNLTFTYNNLTVNGEYSYSFGAYATKNANSNRKSRLGFVSDFYIDKIKVVYHENSKPVKTSYIYKSVPIKGSEYTKVFYK